MICIYPGEIDIEKVLATNNCFTPPYSYEVFFVEYVFFFADAPALAS